MKLGLIMFALVVGSVACSKVPSSSSTDTTGGGSSTSPESADNTGTGTNTTSATLPNGHVAAHGNAANKASATTAAANAKPAPKGAASNANAPAPNANAPTTNAAPAPTLKGTGAVGPVTSGPPKLDASGKTVSCNADKDCDASEHCSAQHTCVCAADKGFSRCSPKAACTNVLGEDTSHCGSCSNVCDNILLCSHGKCEEDI